LDRYTDAISTNEQLDRQPLVTVPLSLTVDKV